MERWVWRWRFVKLHRFFGKLGLSRLRCKIHSKKFFNAILCCKFKKSNWDLNGSNQSCRYQDTSVWMSIRSKNQNFFTVILDYQDFDVRTNAMNFSWRWFAASWQFSVGTLMEEIVELVLEKWKNSKPSFLKTIIKFFALKVNQDWDTREKTLFSWNTRVTGEEFR